MAGSKTNTFETDILGLVFNNTTIAALGDGTGVVGSTVPGSLFVGLLTTDPTETGGGTEATFGAYARQTVARSGAGWTVAGNQVSNAALIGFAEATSGSETISHVGIYDTITGGTMLYHATVTTPRAVATGVTLEFAIGAIVITED